MEVGDLHSFDDEQRHTGQPERNFSCPTSEGDEGHDVDEETDQHEGTGDLHTYPQGHTYYGVHALYAIYVLWE